MKLAISTLRKIIKEEVKKAIHENNGRTMFYDKFMAAFDADPELGYDHDAAMIASSAVSQGESYLSDPEARAEIDFIFKNVGLSMPRDTPTVLAALDDYLTAQKDFSD